MSGESQNDARLFDRQKARREEIVERFETAWAEGRSPAIEDFLPADGERLAVLVELVHVDLERRLKAGEPVRVEAYFRKYPQLAADRHAAVGLILAEYELRRRGEAGLAPDSYLARFPQFVELLLPAMSPSDRRAGPAGGGRPEAGAPAREDVGADRNLLFGIVALQMDFIDREQLIAAMQAWAMDKHRSLGEILVAGGALAEAEHMLLAALVRKHLEKHDRDPQKSLASLSSIGSARDELKKVGDPELEASLAHVSAARHDLAVEQTAPYCVGKSTSEGQRFRVLRPHARGGLGQVSVAYDEELHREVALKEILQQHAQHPESRARFLLEAEITGAMEHPGIVPVYGLGTYADGRPFYVMRFIRGDSLKEAIERFHQGASHGGGAGPRALELRKLLGRVIDVCHAIHYAHSRGVLHRDLKPGNIMLGKYGETLIVDWGLAKPLGRREGPSQAGEATLRPSSESGATPTQIGSALGTPGFMSPEQAAGRLEELGPATDVYGLGATLYALLTGRPPQTGSNVEEALRKIQAGDFPRPRTLNPAIPAPLEAVCLKAMARKPEDRYTSAGEMAEDIEHWLADEPVAAHRESLSARLGRWTRRHRAWAQAVAAALALVAAVSVIAVFLILGAMGRESLQRENAESAHRQAEAARQRAESALKTAERRLYAAEISESQRALESGDVARCQQLLRDCPAAFRNWEYRYLASTAARRLRTFKGPTDSFRPMVTSVAYSPDGRWIASAGEDGAVRIRDAASGDILRTLEGHEREVYSVAFSPEGKRVVSASEDGTVKVWEAATGRILLTLHGHEDGVTSASFSPDGTQIVSGSYDQTVRLWDAQTGEATATLECARPGAVWTAFTHDGNYVVAASSLTLMLPDRWMPLPKEYQGKGRADWILLDCWDADGEKLFERIVPGEKCRGLAVGKEGQPFVIGVGATLRLIDPTTGEETGALYGNIAGVWSVAYSPDGQWIATVSNDGTVRIWDAARREPLCTFRGGRSPYLSVAFSPDSNRVVAGSKDGTLSVFELYDPQEFFVLPAKELEGVALDRDGTRAITIDSFAETCVTDLRSQKIVLTLPGETGHYTAAAFSPDGKWIAAATRDKTLLICDAASGKAIRTFAVPSKSISGLSHVAFSPDGKWIVSSDYEGPVNLWEGATGRHIWTAKTFEDGVRETAFSPDGRQIACAGWADDVLVLDRATGKTRRSLKGHARSVRCAAWSPDGKWIAAGGTEGRVIVWDAASGKALRTLLHGGEVASVAFSPDGQRILCGCQDRRVWLWDSASGERLCTLEHVDKVARVAMSPDGRRILAVGEGAAVKVWEAAPAQPAASPPAASGEPGGAAAARNAAPLWDMTAPRMVRTLLNVGDSIHSVAFSPDGKQIVLGGRQALFAWIDAQTGEDLPQSPENDQDVSGAAFSPDGKHVAAAGADGVVTLWDAATGKRVRALAKRDRAVESVAFSPDGKWIAAGGKDGDVTVSEAATGNTVRTLQGHHSTVTGVAFSPDGMWIVSGGCDYNVMVWEAATGNGVRTLEGHSAPVNGVAFSPAGGRIASASSDGTVRLWDAATGESVRILRGHRSAVSSVAFSRDGAYLVSGSDGAVKVWDASTGEHLVTLKEYPGMVFGVAVSPDGKRIAAVGADGALTVWEAMPPRQATLLEGCGPAVSYVTFSGDGRWIVSGGMDHQARVWDAATGKLSLTVHPMFPVYSVALSRDGSLLALGSEYSFGELELWDARSSKRLRTLEGHKGAVTGVAFSPDGKQLVSASRDKTLRIWDTATGSSIHTLQGHAEAVWDVAFSPDGHRIVSASYDKTLKIWDAATGKEIRTLEGHADAVISVAYGPDGKWLTSGSYDGAVILWDAATGEQIRTLEGHAGGVNSVGFSPDGKRIVSAGCDGAVRVWNAATGDALLALRRHAGWAISAAWSPDGRQIVSGSDDGTVTLWQVPAVAGPSSAASPQGSRSTRR